MSPLTGKARTVAPVVTIKKNGPGDWSWDVWWQTGPGRGPSRHGRTATRWGARRSVRKALR